MKNIIATAFAIILSVSSIQAQKTENSKDEKFYIKIKEEAKPDIYVDGKKFDFPVGMIDTNAIESVTVLKNQVALKKYNSKNGVVLIVTKKNILKGNEIQLNETKRNAEKETAMIIINGKNSSKEELDKLSPDEIIDIEILKDKKKTLKNYKTSKPVIIISTKKG